jgi:hypothetical protein
VTPTVVADDEAARSVRAADEVFTGLSAAAIREELAASPLAADLAAMHEEAASEKADAEPAEAESRAESAEPAE